MSNTRLPVVTMTVALFSTAILAMLTYHGTIEALGSSPSSSGMGDLRLFEAQPNNTSGGVLEKKIYYVGMGDLRRFEAPASGRPNNGIGDLRRFEAEQLLATTGVISAQLPDRICPNLSTSYGERDAGASAPANVLRAMGCLSKP